MREALRALQTLVRELQTINARVISLELAKWPGPDSRQSRVGDLLPLPEGKVLSAYGRAIMERAKRIDTEAAHLAHQALDAGERWTRRIATESLPAVALYHTLYGISGDRALGDPDRVTDRQQRIHYDRARRVSYRPQPIPPSGYSHERMVDRSGPSLGM